MTVAWQERSLTIDEVCQFIARDISKVIRNDQQAVLLDDLLSALVRFDCGYRVMQPDWIKFVFKSIGVPVRSIVTETGVVPGILVSEFRMVLR